LTPADRTILTLHYREGRSYEEIAAILDSPMGTVKIHYPRFIVAKFEGGMLDGLLVSLFAREAATRRHRSEASAAQLS